MQVNALDFRYYPYCMHDINKFRQNIRQTEFPNVIWTSIKALQEAMQDAGS